MEPLRIKNLEIPHRLILAPMCGITLKPFRQLCKELDAGLVFNQMVSARALQMGDQKSFGMLAYDESERPIGKQIFGNNAETLAEAARIVEAQGVDVIDLNLGCPAKKIVNDGGGSALLRDEEELAKILRAMRKAIKGIFTVKIRAGWDDKKRNALSVLHIAEQEGVDALAIHARTRAQGYSGKSDWDFIRHVKENATIPIIGNGDVIEAEDAHRMMKLTGCDAVMTGRGAFAKPWIFKDFVNQTPWNPSKSERADMVMRQYELFVNHFGLEKGIKMMRKFICAYTKGERGGAEFRNKVVRLNDLDIIQEEMRNFFERPDLSIPHKESLPA
ncbi:MAG: tRNA dihydrouridine synthase DusB [Deltaproteobacteria bacterium]|nr:tRNA dihydrouridine synthase DusB [Deltaproteobacteria bacterium]